MKEIEIWKPIKDYEGLYEVSNLGRVKSLEKTLKNRFNYYKTKEKILKPNIGYGGYAFQKIGTEGLNQKTFAIHRLVADAFLTKKNELDIVNHLDLNKTNNKLSNLEWVNFRENVTHKVINTNKNYSNHVGISFDKSREKWTAKIKIEGKLYNLGRFDTEKQAILKYKEYVETKGISNKYIK
jgi:hypothetical protein